MRDTLIKNRELVEMGCKEAETPYLACNVSAISDGSSFTRGASYAVVRQGLRVRSTTHSLMAHARPNPSYVEVPRPSSSIIISESLVADYSSISLMFPLARSELKSTFIKMADVNQPTLRIVAVSSISAMNVETPFN